MSLGKCGRLSILSELFITGKRDKLPVFFRGRLRQIDRRVRFSKKNDWRPGKSLNTTPCRKGKHVSAVGDANRLIGQHALISNCWFWLDSWQRQICVSPFTGSSWLQHHFAYCVLNTDHYAITRVIPIYNYLQDPRQQLKSTVYHEKYRHKKRVQN